MTLVADSQGVVLGKFTIPANVPAGTKGVNFAGAGGSSAQATFIGQGTLIDDIRTLVTQITTTRWQVNVDPIAQTFTLAEPMQLDGVDLWFTVKGTTTVAVQIRETQVGYPNQTIIADSRLEPSAITAGQWTRFTFGTAARLEAGVEYAIVALCNDSVAELAVAELGKFDAAAQQWITQQPYNVGVLLSSSNASTWTPYQDRDLAFRLVARQYTEAERLVDMGTVAINQASELLVLTMLETPTSAATGDIELSMPDGSVIKAGDGQVVSFSTPTTGTVGVKARLRSNQNSSAALHPGTQIVQGKVHSTDSYISLAIDADAAGCTVKVVFSAIIPSGATVVAEVSGVDAGDAWLSLTQIGTPKLIDGDLNLYEYQFERTGVTEARVRGRLTLNLGGSITARPRVRDFRIFTL